MTDAELVLEQVADAIEEKIQRLSKVNMYADWTTKEVIAELEDIQRMLDR